MKFFTPLITKHYFEYIDYNDKNDSMADGSLTLSIYKSHLLTAGFGKEKVGVHNYNHQSDVNSRWYIKPSIAISSLIDSILTQPLLYSN